ncbi:GNAT family N-acetyltransferase [Rheinheimera sp. SA_1]|uniref:GNAT family N-acetyltransferase n=1 Tax=Rheinheimera sp. SA_1 TaxID=1827365 RepID=UPI000A95B654|nr:GNAT family N-acetyltransferase [Rheinheimera sp. SA_1]
MTQTTEILQVPDSARLRFRLFDRDDAQPLFELDQDPEVMRFLSAGVCTTMEQIEQRMLPRMLAYRNPALGYGIWQVTTRADCELLPACYIGWILVRPMGFFTENPQLDNLELGWRFKRESWGFGFATEAANAVAEAVAKHATAQQQPLRYLSALAVPDNQPSIAVMQKLGMQFVSQRLHHDPMWTAEVVEYCKTLTV